jgi:hypothetical protein
VKLARRYKGLPLAVGAMAGLVVWGLGVRVASAKGPCGKKGSCERLIQRVKVSHVRGTQAGLEAVINGEAEYEFWLRTPHEEVVIASGHTAPGIKEQQKVRVVVQELTRSTTYVFWVEAVERGKREGCSECSLDSRKFKTKR